MCIEQELTERRGKEGGEREEKECGDEREERRACE